MKDKTILEIAVESVAAARAAERGGADRVELCANLRCGGLTPNVEMMQITRSTIKIPTFAMIRTRAGNFVYTEDEFAAMQRDIELARELRMDGVVLGVLREDFAVDVERTRELVSQAGPMQVTFHRAFDECRDLLQAMEDVIKTGADRILTCCAKPGVACGLSELRALIRRAGERIIVVPGGGITPENFALVQEATGAWEFHSGLGSVLEYGSGDIPSFENAVRELAGQKKHRSIDRSLQ